MSGPLEGIRVIELTTMITGPLAVIKIEPPEGGDAFRSFRGGLYSPHFCGPQGEVLEGRMRPSPRHTSW